MPRKMDRETWIVVIASATALAVVYILNQLFRG